jgi:hypothetical protein
MTSDTYLVYSPKTDLGILDHQPLEAGEQVEWPKKILSCLV